VKATSPLDNGITLGNLCIKGRFGWRFVQRGPEARKPEARKLEAGSGA
jgi:predicted molibdopterin-dependent oxidoreductase YjgC